ncbi:hypothetical protein ACCC98_32560, partial [Rhizobium pisi]|uniref:hypothetical protein n=1 Tax=Rhizobium pisi TaxID=574561 RepID=UPI0039AF6710
SISPRCETRGQFFISLGGQFLISPDNSGWLKQIEDANKAFLASIIEGKEYLLTREKQSTLATWIASRAAIWERDDPKTAAMSTEDYTWLAEKHTPPEHWNIWIGLSTGTDWRLRIRHFGAAAGYKHSHNGVPSFNFQKTTIGLVRIMVE